MNSYQKFASVVALALAFGSIAATNVRAEEERPRLREEAAADKANKQLDVVYRDLMAKADTKMKTRLRAAQLAWIKWKTAEANYIARRVAMGGSALRGAYAEAEEKLVNERIVVLKTYASE